MTVATGDLYGQMCFLIPAAINHMFLGNLLKKLSLNMKFFEHVSYVSFGSKGTGQSVMRNIFSLNLLCTSLSVTEIPTYL